MEYKEEKEYDPDEVVGTFIINGMKFEMHANMTIESVCYKQEDNKFECDDCIFEKVCHISEEHNMRCLFCNEEITADTIWYQMMTKQVVPCCDCYIEMKYEGRLRKVPCETNYDIKINVFDCIKCKDKDCLSKNGINDNIAMYISLGINLVVAE